MTLTIAILMAVAVTAAFAYGAWRFPTRLPRVATLVVVATPLLLLTLLLRGRSDGRSGQSLQVIGQYAFLLDTLRIGADPGADVRISAPSSGRAATGLVSVHFRPNDSALVVRTAAGAPPVVVGDRILSAGIVGRSAAVSVARAGSAPVAVAVGMPWWPIGCTTRIASLCASRVVRVNGAAATIRVPDNGVWSDAIGPSLARVPSFALFRRGGRVYVTAGARTTLTLNGAALPAEAAIANGSNATGALAIGFGREVSRLRVVADRRANRLEVMFGGRLVGERWPLHAGNDRAVHRVTYGAPASPGTLPLIDLNGVPLGENAVPYSGALEWAPGRWRWHADGRVRALATGETILLPGT